jgi:tRNA pseudouridine55 synthase
VVTAAPALASPTGIVLVDKPGGLTSHDVVARARRLLGTRKVGHAGTLDPMATGLLVLGVGASTRLLTYLVGLDKEYLATIRLGAGSTTDDAEGELLERADASGITDDAIANEAAALTGEVMQRPSSVSAIKVDGKRAYALAREGVEVELAARPVTISALELLGTRRGEWVDLDVRVDCSSGTYVRAIARDLGNALGVGGHLTALRRTRVGPFMIDEAEALDESLPQRMLDAASVARRLFPVVDLTEQQAIDLVHGKRPGMPGEGSPVAAIGPDGRLVALVQLSGGTARVLVGFPQEAS